MRQTCYKRRQPRKVGRISGIAYPSIYLPVYVTYLSIYLFICLSLSMHIYIWRFGHHKYRQLGFELQPLKLPSRGAVTAVLDEALEAPGSELFPKPGLYF